MTLSGHYSEELLNIPMSQNDAGATTVREYLAAIILRLWVEDGEFIAQQPFGNFGWWVDLAQAFSKAGLAVTDDNGSLDYDKTSEFVKEAIKQLGEPPLYASAS